MKFPIRDLFLVTVIVGCEEVMVPDEDERQEVWQIVDFRDSHGLSFAEIADQLERVRAARENREPWPRVPFKGSENRRWDQNRVYKAYKTRKRVPMPSSTMRLAFD